MSKVKALTVQQEKYNPINSELAFFYALDRSYFQTAEVYISHKKTASEKSYFTAVVDSLLVNRLEDMREYGFYFLSASSWIDTDHIQLMFMDRPN